MCFLIVVVSSGTTKYSSSLTINHPRYARSDNETALFYYEAIQISVTSSENYTIRSNSVSDMYGYLYRNTFDPINSSSNLLTQDDDGGGSGQFHLNVPLQASVTYVLIVTTFHPNELANFSITASDVVKITFNRITVISSAPTSTGSGKMITTSSICDVDFEYGGSDRIPQLEVFLIDFCFNFLSSRTDVCLHTLQPDSI